MELYKITGYADKINEDFLVQVNSFNKLGIKSIEIRGVNGVNISRLERSEIKEIKRILKKADIKVSSIASPIGKIFITDYFEEHFEVFKKIVEAAKLLDTKYIRIFSFFIPEGKDALEYREGVIKRLRALVIYFSKKIKQIFLKLLSNFFYFSLDIYILI